MRDMGKAIEEGRKISRENSRADMTAAEMKVFYDRFYDGEIWDVISDAFCFGVAIGSRIEKRAEKD